MNKRKDLIFIVIGALLLIATVSAVFYSINFLVKNIRIVLDEDSVDSKKVIKFNLEGLNDLGIMR